MAESHLQAYAEVRSLKLAKIYSPNRAHRESLAERMQRELPFEILAVEKPELALGKSDIVASCTDAGEAVLFGDWLEDGMHVTIVNHREADEQVYRRISRYIDYQSGHAINLYTSGKERRPRTIGGAGADHDRLGRLCQRATLSIRGFIARQSGGARVQNGDQLVQERRNRGAICRPGPAGLSAMQGKPPWM